MNTRYATITCALDYSDSHSISINKIADMGTGISKYFSQSDGVPIIDTEMTSQGLLTNQTARNITNRRQALPIHMPETKRCLTSDDVYEMIDELAEPRIKRGHSNPNKVKTPLFEESLEATGPKIKRPSDKMAKFFDTHSEEDVLRVIHGVIHKGVNLNELLIGDDDNTVLHKAVMHRFLSVAEKALDYGIDPLAYDKCGKTPLRLALDEKNDEMAALILSRLPKCDVRRLFDDRKHIASGQREAKPSGRSTERGPVQCTSECEMRYLIEFKLDQTLTHVLDSFMEEQKNGHYDVHVKLLDTDEDGREPNDPRVNLTHHTVFQKLAISEKKDALNHPVMRTFVEHKWIQWCKRRFRSPDHGHDEILGSLDVRQTMSVSCVPTSIVAKKKCTVILMEHAINGIVLVGHSKTPQ